MLLLPIFFWRKTRILFENFTEIGVVVVSDLIGDFIYFQLSIEQVSLRVFNTNPSQVRDEVLPFSCLNNRLK